MPLRSTLALLCHKSLIVTFAAAAASCRGTGHLYNMSRSSCITVGTVINRVVVPSSSCYGATVALLLCFCCDMCDIKWHMAPADIFCMCSSHSNQYYLLFTGDGNYSLWRIILFSKIKLPETIVFILSVFPLLWSWELKIADSLSWYLGIWIFPIWNISIIY